MKMLFGYLKKYRIQAICSPLFKLLEVVFELLVPLVVASIIDKGVTSGDSGYVLRRGGLLVLLGAVGLICTLFAQYFAAKASVGATALLRTDLFKKINELSSGQTDKIGSASLITRMTSDTQQIQTGLNLALRLILRSPFVVFGSAVAAYLIDPSSGIIFIITIAILAVVIFAIMLVNIRTYKNVQTKLDGVTSRLRQNLAGIRVIRAFCKEKPEEAEFNIANDELIGRQKSAGRISALLNPLTYVIINIAVIALIKNDALRVYSGKLTQGEVVALYNYMARMLIELVKLANLIINMSKMAACSHRVDAILKTEPSLQSGQGAETHGDIAVQFDNVSFKYSKKADCALKGISFSAKSGETVGIIGGTGSGKSTLAALIPRLYDVTGGTVSVFGNNVKDYDLPKLRQTVGFVLQRAMLFRGTVRDNIKMGKEDADDSEIYAALTAAQAKDFIDRTGMGLAYMLEQGGNNLSGGQKQRLTIARALIRHPKILILDDSSSALDFATDARLRSAIKDYCDDSTVFIISQRTSALRSADKIIVLDGGEIKGIGSHEELLQTCEVYREIHLSQTKKEGE